MTRKALTIATIISIIERGKDVSVSRVSEETKVGLIVGKSRYRGDGVPSITLVYPLSTRIAFSGTDEAIWADDKADIVVFCTVTVYVIL